MSTSLIFLSAVILWSLSTFFLFWKQTQSSKAPLPTCQTSTLIIALLSWLMASMASSGQLDLKNTYESIRQMLAPGWLPFFPQELNQAQSVLKTLFFQFILAIIWICLLRYDKQTTSKGLGIQAIPYLPIWFTSIAGTLFLIDKSLEYFGVRLFLVNESSLYLLPKILSLFQLCFLAPLVEEVFFRGWLLTWLSQSLRPWLANIIVTVFCVFMALPSGASGDIFTTLKIAIETKYIILALTSLIFGACYLQSRSLILVILLHASYNAFTIWLTLFSGLKNG
jgi:membrane protease YdiL (CAAX protease family)